MTNKAKIEQVALPKITVLDHGYVKLRNIAGPIRRPGLLFDASDTDPANAARFSFDNADKDDRPESDDLKLCRYLYKNRHNTPFEMTEVWLEMKLPLFVARQLVRHRTVSINEVSARYSRLPKDFYIPNPECVGRKSKTNKQGRDTFSDLTTGELQINRSFSATLSARSEEAHAKYTHALDCGIPNELARLFLPVNVYTKWLWNQDLHNMLHFLRLRLDQHTQYETRQYAEAIFDLLSSVLPHTMALFKEEFPR